MESSARRHSEAPATGRVRTERGAVVALSLVAVSIVMSACGAVQGRGRDDGSAEFDGIVSVRGSAEFGAAYFETEDRTVYILQQSNAAYEVAALDGMDVRLRAILLPQKLREMPILQVRSYELLPLPTGERPVIGIIYADPYNDRIYLVDKGGVLYHIGGDFRRTLMDYNGAKVWIAGDIGFSTVRLQERAIDVRVYGIIAERGGLQF